MQPGGDGRFYWDGHGWFPIRVEAVDPPRYLAWRWGLESEADPTTDATSTLVEWWVEPSGEGTLLRMRESGFHQAEQRENNDGGWTSELAELVSLLAARA
ncbi:MAG: SRPBCC domain-containing protein [Chloroflexi bacterium]|nr:SRPBCC domain-containing protein [Chloroflexota bacterium]